MMFGRRSRSSQASINLASLPGCAVACAAGERASVRQAASSVWRAISRAMWAATERLDQMARELRLSGAHLSILLEGQEYQFLQIEPPAVPAEELKTAVRWQVKEMLRYPVDAVTLDVLPSPADGLAARRPSAWVVVAPNNLVRERMLQFRAYNTDVAVIDVPEMAQRNLADRLEEHGRATAVLSINQSGALLTASREGVLYFTRNFELSTLSLGYLSLGAA